MYDLTSDQVLLHTGATHPLGCKAPYKETCPPNVSPSIVLGAKGMMNVFKIGKAIFPSKFNFNIALLSRFEKWVMLHMGIICKLLFFRLRRYTRASMVLNGLCLWICICRSGHVSSSLCQSL